MNRDVKAIIVGLAVLFQLLLATTALGYTSETMWQDATNDPESEQGEPTPSWSPWEIHPGQVAGGMDVASWGTGRLDVFARGPNGNVITKYFPGAHPWSQWISIGSPMGQPIIGDPSVVSWGANRLDVFVRGADNRLWTRYWNGSGSWSAWISLGAPSAPPKPGNAPTGLSSSPDVTSWGPDILHVVARGPDNAPWIRSWNGSTWSAWTSLGGEITADPSIVSWGPGRLDIFVRGLDNALWTKSWDERGWTPYASLGGGIRGGPDAASWGPNRLDVFVRGLDDAVWRKVYDGSGWSDYQLIGGQITADPGAVAGWGLARVYGRVDLFVRGIDGQMSAKSEVTPETTPTAPWIGPNYCAARNDPETSPHVGAANVECGAGGIAEWEESETVTISEAGTFAGGSTSAQGCQTINIQEDSYTLFGHHAWDFHQVKHWCWDYPRITQVDVGTYIHIDGEDECCFVYRGIVSQYGNYYSWKPAKRKSGHVSLRQGDVGNCFLRYGCILSKYPIVKIYVHGDGSWKAYTGGG